MGFVMEINFHRAKTVISRGLRLCCSPSPRWHCGWLASQSPAFRRVVVTGFTSWPHAISLETSLRREAERPLCGFRFSTGWHGILSAKYCEQRWIFWKNAPKKAGGALIEKRYYMYNTFLTSSLGHVQASLPATLSSSVNKKIKKENW